MRILDKIQGRYQRLRAKYAGTRMGRLNLAKPRISFTFDDFPASAASIGAGILENHNVRGTYYASLGLIGKTTPTGQMFSASDLVEVFDRGHELGCHTFSHQDAWKTRPAAFYRDVEANSEALKTMLPHTKFNTLSFPISCPRPLTKRMVGPLFSCCRCGGQSINGSEVDLNYLSAFFLEKTQNDFDAVRRVIDLACSQPGWLIFATHDISDTPTPFGCTPSFFARVVDYSCQSGAAVMPVHQALLSLQ